MQHLKGKWLWLGFLIMVVLSGVHLQNAWQWNIRALHLLKRKGEAIPIKALGCDHLVLIGAEAGERGDISVQHNIMEHALGCSRTNISIVSTVFPLDEDLALLATQLYPDSSRSWFWLGESIAPTDHLRARQAYLRNVELSPKNGLTWCRLGFNYYDHGQEFEKALDAFLNCCYYGDRGSNGCYGAGRMMERLGNPQQAIEYYRLSKWDGALKRADELENQVKP